MIYLPTPASASATATSFVEPVTSNAVVRDAIDAILEEVEGLFGCFAIDDMFLNYDDLDKAAGHLDPSDFQHYVLMNGLSGHSEVRRALAKYRSLHDC